MNKLFKLLVTVLFMVFCMGVSSIAEEITLTTYHTAPLGNYDELQATKLAVGSSTTMPATDGDLEASGTVQADTVRANTVFNINGTDGYTETFTVVINLRPSFMVPYAMDVFKRTITVEGGIVTNVSSYSWEMLEDVFNP